MIKIEYYAHTSEKDDKNWQTIFEHSKNTAKIASKNAAAFNAKEAGYICGLLHDIGKYSEKFQRKLKGENLRVDHSSAGAKESIKLFGESWGKLFAYCISGHHSGLLDYGTEASASGTLFSRLNSTLNDYSIYNQDLGIDTLKVKPEMKIKPNPDNPGFSYAFFIRMLYSSLVDADFIETESYMSDVIKDRGSFDSITKLKDSLDHVLSNFDCPKTFIDEKRNEILGQCIKSAAMSQGLYSLTVPTGGGKTLSSMIYGLRHAKKHNLKRVIYVIPYTSIIEQNANVFKEALGNKNVLEHHSNFQFENYCDEEYKSMNEKIKLATENWDIPVVVTTNVQFFESLFANRSSKCRKLHNIAQSVIIFDEAQMIPVQYLKPCFTAIYELVKNYKVTAVLCTATQPAINKFLPEGTVIKEIMVSPKNLYKDFKKVEVEYVGNMCDNSLVDLINREKQALCIVNTRKHAKEIFNLIGGEKYHLSTLMCPIHRKQVLENIRQKLKEGKECKVVSTQLIEAGVDVDFPSVYRALAGVDSIVQSAGRCNREGKLKSGKVYVFKPDSEYAKIKGYIERTAKISEMVLRKHNDPISLEAIKYYFDMLYDIEGDSELDKKDILDELDSGYRQLEFNFKTVAESFKLIENSTQAIIIPYDNKAKKLINDAKYSPYPLSLGRKLQQYSVSIYDYEYNALLDSGAIEIINDSFSVLKEYHKYYLSDTGVIVPKLNYGEGIFI